jgi:hypothetical protein
MQNQGMQPIDLVKHQNTILPGLEEAAHSLIGRLNEARKLIDRAPLILIEDAREVNRLYRERKARREKAVAKEWRRKKQKEDAEQVRIRIEQRQQDARLKTRNVKTLVKRRSA